MVGDTVRHYVDRLATWWLRRRVTRLTVINDYGGRSAEHWFCELEFARQDDGRTLKIWVHKRTLQKSAS